MIKGDMNMMHGIYSVKTPDWLDRVGWRPLRRVLGGGAFTRL